MHLQADTKVSEKHDVSLFRVGYAEGTVHRNVAVYFQVHIVSLVQQWQLDGLENLKPQFYCDD